MNPTNYHNGRLAEFCARLWLRCKGYRIIAVNYKTGRGTKAGEIDFIACRGKTLVFAEVKKRRTLDNAAYSILPAQQKELSAAPRLFCKNIRSIGIIECALTRYWCLFLCGFAILKTPGLLGKKFPLQFWPVALS